MIKFLLPFIIITSLGFGGVHPKPPEWDGWTFDEKRTWRGRHPDPRIQYKVLVDKFRVKEVLAGQDTVKVAKTYYHTNDPSTILLENLPSSFVMKANNACNCTLKVVDGIVHASCKQCFKPKPATNEILIKYATDFLKTKYWYNYGEKQYSLVTPTILFEEYLPNLSMDIEFFCFYGKVRLVKAGYYQKQWKDFYYDLDWNLLKTNTPGAKVARPEWLEKMISFTEELAKNIDHVRVDYFVCGNDIYFGECTFTTGERVVPKILQMEISSYWLYPDESVVDENFGKLPNFSKAEPDVL